MHAKMSNLKNEHLKVLVYSILAQIVSENEYDKLNDSSSDIIESLVFFLNESLKKEIVIQPTLRINKQKSMQVSNTLLVIRYKISNRVQLCLPKSWKIKNTRM